MIRETMSEYGDFRDYDDANIISFYNGLQENQKLAIDNVFTYLCGITFGQIVIKYSEQYESGK